jgi:hypothetical protein
MMPLDQSAYNWNQNIEYDNKSFGHAVGLASQPPTRRAPADEHALARHPLPRGEGSPFLVSAAWRRRIWVALNLHPTLDDLLICCPGRGEKRLDAFNLT